MTKKQRMRLITRYIEPFKVEITDMFIAVRNDKSKRMGAGRMLQKLRATHPQRFDLPSETEIRQAITTLMAKEKSGKDVTLKTRQNSMHPYYLRSIIIMYNDDPKIMPKNAWALFIAQHPPPSNHEELNEITQTYPKESAVKTKIYWCRKQHAKTKALPEVPDLEA
jgi:hypothetical protein